MAVSQMMPESGSRLQRKRARNRDALIASARRLFARQGFEATTIAGIAEAADLGFGTFYRYFPDKEAILDAVLGAAKAEIDTVLSHPSNHEAPPAVALKGLTARFAQAMRRNHDLLSVVWQVGLRGDTPGGKRVRPDRLPPEKSLPVMLAATIRRIIERGVASGEFAAVDPALASRFLSSAHMYFFTPKAFDKGDERLIGTLCHLELCALGATSNDVPLMAEMNGEGLRGDAGP